MSVLDLMEPGPQCAVSGCNETPSLACVWATPVPSGAGVMKDSYCETHGRAMMRTMRRFKQGTFIDEEEADTLRERLSELLTQTADALRGPPPPLTHHDWSTLPEHAAKLNVRLSEALLQMGKANASVAELEAELDGMRAEYARLVSELDRCRGAETKAAELMEEMDAKLERHRKLSWDATRAADRAVQELKGLRERLATRQSNARRGLAGPLTHEEMLAKLDAAILSAQRQVEKE